MKKSIAGRDPLVLYLKTGGIFNNSKHIVAVVGYDPNDSPQEGGTFIINNPAPGDVKVGTRIAEPGNGKKLTANHIKQYLGGDNQEEYHTSVIIREIYTK
jgi:hypothetical protein